MVLSNNTETTVFPSLYLLLFPPFCIINFKKSEKDDVSDALKEV